MAQYYQVLSQSEKPSAENIRQYFPNLVENGTVQYVISREEPQHFVNQQILVSSGDQLMVVNSQPQVIVEQPPQITYQNSQYVVQSNGIEFQHKSRQTFCMEETDNSVEQSSQTQQTIVLNHMQQGQIRPPAGILKMEQNRPSPMRHQTQQRPVQVPQQPSQTRSRLPTPVRSPLQHPPVRSPMPQLVRPPVRAPLQMPQPRPVQHVQPQKNAPNVNSRVGVARTPAPTSLHPSLATPVVRTDEIVESDNQEAVALSDGSVITLAEYKKLVAEQQQQQQRQQNLKIAERNEALDPPYSPTSKRKGNNRGRGRRTGRGGRNPRTPASPPAEKNSKFTPRQQQQQPRFNPQQQQAQQRAAHPQNQYHLQQQQQLIQQQQQKRLQQLAQQQQQQIRQPVPQPQVQQPVPQPPVQQPVSQPQYLIQPHVAQNPVQQQCNVLPPFIPSSQIQQIIESTPISEEYTDSIRMLVLLADGEQRLITFTLPKEACTIQEILEQVNVPFKPDTNIGVVEYSNCGLNYIVTVGCPNTLAPPTLQSPEQPQVSIEPPPLVPVHKSEDSDAGTVSSEGIEPSVTPELEKEVPKLVAGKLAVCMHCGYLSEDFNKCLRCKRKLPEDVKAVPSLNNKKAEAMKAQEKKSPQKVNPPKQSNSNGTPKKKAKPKIVDTEPVILTLSSDEEEEDSKKTATEQLIRKLSESSVTISTIKKEPTISDIQQNNVRELHSEGDSPKDANKEETMDQAICVPIICRTIRIGSYRFVSSESLLVSSNGLLMKVPHPKNPADIKTITIDRKHIVKVLVNFHKTLPVIFYYVMKHVGDSIREQLGMVEGGDVYFDPLSREEAFKRITVLPEYLYEEVKDLFKQIYEKPYNIMDELTLKEANNILVLTCPKDYSSVIPGSSFTNIKQLLIYPPGKGGLSINTEDYLCLAQDQFLNDVIIDFYLKYTVLNLPKSKQEKVHVFSTFFYKRLTTKPVKASRKSHPTELDPSLTPAEKRHARVKSWTKNVNLFEKDYIIIPLNENSHWFLAIICYPGLDGPVNIDGNPVKIEPKQRKMKKKMSVSTIGNVTVTTVKAEKDEKPITCDDPELSDKDEAEADESELDSDQESVEEAPPSQDPNKRQAIKQPCILIFDSLAGASRSRVVATLRDYLTCEYKAKMEEEKVFNKDVIKGACPKVPQQTNFTDCGLYLLQYVEQFFKDPIKDYHIPIKEIQNWFDELTVTKKREDIAKLIKQLMKEYNKDTSMLPDLLLPTLDGKIVDRPFLEEEEEEEEEEEMEEDEDMMDDGEIPAGFEEISGTICSAEKTELNDSKITVSSDSVESSVKEGTYSVNQVDGFLEQTITNDVMKPDFSEMQKQSNRDTMSYLKAKRIIRHKPSDSSDIKKFKSSE